MDELICRRCWEARSGWCQNAAWRLCQGLSELPREADHHQSDTDSSFERWIRSGVAKKKKKSLCGGVIGLHSFQNM